MDVTSQEKQSLDKYDEITLEWLRRQDVSGKTPGEFAEMFKSARKEIKSALLAESAKNFKNVIG